MSTPTASPPDRPWLVEDVRVAIITGGGTRRTYHEAVVAKLTKTQVVLDNGDRYNRDTLSRRGASTWDPTRSLHELNSPQAVEARALRTLRSHRDAARKMLNEFSKTIDAAAFDAPIPDPYDLIHEIQRLHAGSMMSAAMIKKDS